MEYIVILAIVIVSMLVIETVSIVGSARTYGIGLPATSWPFLIINISKINHTRNLNSYNSAKITLFVVLRMWMTAKESDKDDILQMDKDKYGGVVGKLVKKGKVTDKW